jgi:hypothetical protein
MCSYLRLRPLDPEPETSRFPSLSSVSAILGLDKRNHKPIWKSLAQQLRGPIEGAAAIVGRVHL